MRDRTKGLFNFIVIWGWDNRLRLKLHLLSHLNMCSLGFSVDVDVDVATFFETMPQVDDAVVKNDFLCSLVNWIQCLVLFLIQLLLVVGLAELLFRHEPGSGLFDKTVTTKTSFRLQTSSSSPLTSEPELSSFLVCSNLRRKSMEKFFADFLASETGKISPNREAADKKIWINIYKKRASYSNFMIRYSLRIRSCRKMTNSNRKLSLKNFGIRMWDRSATNADDTIQIHSKIYQIKMCRFFTARSAY